MNIFALDNDPVKCARAHHDKHVVKMILETAQMMATVLRREIDAKEADEMGIYKSTHANHPCTLWLLESSKNYAWAYDLIIALNDEYHFRYGKDHASYLAAISWPYPSELPVTKYRTAFAQAMPEEYQRENAIHAYRAYYNGKKVEGAKWTKRGKPDWVITTATDGGRNDKTA